MNKTVLITIITGGCGAISMIVLTPLLIAVCGIQGYGIIALWQLLLGLVLLCDFGMGNTVTKFVAEINTNKNKEILLNGFITFEKTYMLIVGVLAVLFFSIKNEIGNHASKGIYDGKYELIFTLITISILAQLHCSLYVNTLSGLMEFKINNLMQLAVILYRFIGGYFAAWLWGGVIGFFIAQAISSPVLIIIYRCVCIKKMGGWAGDWREFNWKIIKNNYKYSIIVSITAILGLLISNVDRYLISIYENISKLGEYSIATTASSLIGFMAAAFYKVYFPKLVYFRSKNQQKAMMDCYMEGTKQISTITIGIAVVAIIYAKPLFEIWIDKPSDELVYIFRLQVFGLTLSGIMWLTAALQQATGFVKMHLVLMAASIIVGILFTYFSVKIFGMCGYTLTAISHGVIEITFGLILLDKEKYKIPLKLWYAKNLFKPIIYSVVISVPSYYIYEIYNTKTIGLTLAISSFFVYALLSLEKKPWYEK